MRKDKVIHHTEVTGRKLLTSNERTVMIGKRKRETKAQTAERLKTGEELFRPIELLCKDPRCGMEHHKELARDLRRVYDCRFRVWDRW